MRNKLSGHIVFLLCIGLLCTLGVWQLKRLHWKNALVAEIAQRSAAAPMPSRWLDLMAKTNDFNWRKIAISGTCAVDNLFLLQGKFLNAQGGYNLMCRAQLPNGKQLLVNFGWVPLNYQLPPVDHAAPHNFTAIAILKPFSPRPWYMPADQADRRLYVWLAPVDQSYPIYADIIGSEARQSDPVLAQAQPTGTMPELRNEHLAYALTWFTLAIIAAIIYGVRVYGKKPHG